MNTNNSQTKMQINLPFYKILYIREAYLKDYFMLNRLKTYWKETAAVAVVAVGTAFGASSASAEGAWFKTTDIRNWAENDVISAPYRASNDRIAVILYGDNDSVRGPVEYAAEYYATAAPGTTNVRYLWAKDNDGHPGTLRVGIYANGRHYGDLDIGIDRAATKEGQEEIVNAVYNQMHGAYLKHLAKPAEPPKVAARDPAPTD